MKRILLTIPTITSYHTFLKELMTALGQQGWDVHLACSLEPIAGFDCYDDQVAGTAHDIRFPRGANIYRHLEAGRSLDALVRKIRPDVIHCHFSVTAFTAALSRKKTWPVSIATIQGLMFAETSGCRKWGFAAAEGFVTRRLDGTWVLTRSDQQALARLGLRRNIFLQESSGFGCRLDRFDRTRFDAVSCAELRRELGIEPDEFVFIFVGRQVHFKGFGLAARSFLDLAERWPRAKLLLVGQRDPLHSSGLTSAQEASLAASTRVVQVGWQENVARYLALAHANVFPSQREGIPVNLMESLAMGVPVITLNTRGCRDVVRDELDGLIVSQATQVALVAAMERLLGDEIFRSMLATNAVAGRNRFDRRTWISEQIAIYDRVLRLHTEGKSS